MKHIETGMFVLMVVSWGLLGAGLGLAVLKWLLRNEGVRWSSVWRRHGARFRQVVRRLGSRIQVLGAVAWRAYCKRSRTVLVQFLVADDQARGDLEPHLRAGLARLARATGMSLPPESAVLVQRTIDEGGPTCGLNQTLPLPGGGRRVLLRLALEVDGQTRTSDQLLSTLADQYIALVAPGAEVHTGTTVEQRRESRSVQARDAVRRAHVAGAAKRSATRPHIMMLAPLQQDDSSSAPAAQDTVTSHSPTTSSDGDPLVAPAHPAERAG